jgi:hypothetical protein
VISTESDYRLPAIREAVHFWNAELSKLGSPFRLGSLVHVVVQAIPPGDTLMCGDAQCGFESYSEEFLPITAKEKTTLLEMYPPEWQPKPFGRWVTDPPYPPSGQR